MKTILLFASIVLLSISSCNNDDSPLPENSSYKQEMRNFVQNISTYAKGINPTFQIIPQNGHNLVTVDGETSGALDTKYLLAIDGQGREDLYYGYENDNEATPTADTDEMIPFLDICIQNDIQVLVTDYCSTHSKMDDSYRKSTVKGYLSFAAPERDLNVVPDYPATPLNVNSNDINELSDAKNFLYLINSEKYSSKQAFIAAVAATDYDVVLIDYAFDENPYTTDEINSMKLKNNGGKRLVISYMSIGEAETYRYYWQSKWKPGSPEWLDKENPDWAGNYKVKYWNADWQSIIYGNDSSYLKKILDAGFDGVYLDIIDAFEYYEE
jgi:cysteinyl-tRNA synthetase